MYILFELTGTDMVFTTKDEAGVTIVTDTFPLSTYELSPYDKLASDSMVVRVLGEPLGTWPPKASYPKNRIIFKNSATLPFQSENEGSVDLP